MRNRTILIGVAILVVAGLAWAGGDKSGSYSPADHAAKLQKKLGLTDQQAQEVQAVFEETHMKIAEVKASGADKATIKAEKTKLKQARDARLKEIFTAEQWAQYEELMKRPVRQAETKP